MCRHQSCIYPKSGQSLRRRGGERRDNSTPVAQAVGDILRVSANIPNPHSIRCHLGTWFSVVSFWMFCAFWSLHSTDPLEGWDMAFGKAACTCVLFLVCCLLSALQKESPSQTAPQKFLYLKIATIKSLRSPFGFSSYILHDSRKSLNI